MGGLLFLGVDLRGVGKFFGVDLVGRGYSFFGW